MIRKGYPMWVAFFYSKKIFFGIVSLCEYLLYICIIKQTKTNIMTSKEKEKAIESLEAIAHFIQNNKRSIMRKHCFEYDLGTLALELNEIKEEYKKYLKE